ncbi:hypothetical protein T440DRAFT_455523 [Plenodomus tracheiphilus IPT5]|uniref:DUF7730 domain-containing protein n=1 Tax=Plenodomus tracheiphilus IPT5 TaxID=1408161 RepID=A0A6A7B0A1_9PLEO|nr:hypothetical protein T440DRAFT_455523 [Plenodomus tracheiphilus IPT5]
MAPSLRQKTKEKTKASVKAAKDAGFVARIRKPPTRRQMYKHNKGLVSLRTSKDNSSMRPGPHLLEDMAITLPRVCRQIYFETATLLYSENLFTFASVKNLRKWLSKRILAQREAIRYIFLPRSAYYHFNPPGGRIIPMTYDERIEAHRPYVEHEVNRACPNLFALEDDEFLDDRSSDEEPWDITSRFMYPSSGDDLADLISD